MKTILSSIFIFLVLAPGLPYFDASKENPNKAENPAVDWKHTREKKIKKNSA